MTACGGCNQKHTSPQKHCLGMQQWKVKTQNWSWWVMWKVSRRSSTGAVASKGRSSDIVGSSWHRTCKGLMLSVPSSPWYLLQGQDSWASIPTERWDVLPITVEHQSRDPSHKLDTTKELMGPDGILQSGHWETRPKPWEGCSLSSLRKHSNLLRSQHKKKGKCQTCLQKAEERGFRKLRANQPHLSPWKYYRTNSPRNNFEL